MNLYKTFNQNRPTEKIVSGAVTARGASANTYTVKLSNGVVLTDLWSRAHTLSVGMTVILLHNTATGKYVVVDKASSPETAFKEVRV